MSGVRFNESAGILTIGRKCWKLSCSHLWEWDEGTSNIRDLHAFKCSLCQASLLLKNSSTSPLGCWYCNSGDRALLLTRHFRGITPSGILLAICSRCDSVLYDGVEPYPYLFDMEELSV